MARKAEVPAQAVPVPAATAMAAGPRAGSANGSRSSSKKPPRTRPSATPDREPERDRAGRTATGTEAAIGAAPDLDRASGAEAEADL